jgi:hypothetical protein
MIMQAMEEVVVVDRVETFRGSTNNTHSAGSTLDPLIVVGAMGCGSSPCSFVVSLLCLLSLIISGKSLLLRRFAREQAAAVLVSTRVGSGFSDQTPSKKVDGSSNPTDDLSDGLVAMMEALGLPWKRPIFDFLAAMKASASPAGLMLQNWDRMWYVLEQGVEKYRRAFPNRYVTIIFDEMTFLLPRPQDNTETVQLKLRFLRRLQNKSIEHAHDKCDIQFYFASSSPRIFHVDFFGTFSFQSLSSMAALFSRLFVQIGTK